MSGNSGFATRNWPTTSISSRFTCCLIGRTFRFAPKTRRRMSIDIRKQGGAGLSRQGNPDRRGRVAEQGTDARRRAAIPHQPGAFHIRASRSREAAKTFASICSRPMTSRGSVSGKAPWVPIGACSMERPAPLKYPPGVADQQLSALEAATGKRARAEHFRVWRRPFGRRRRQSAPRLAPWVAVAISATVGGILLG